MTEIKKSKPRIRSADAMQKRILAAAKIEFAENGLGGARVDVIAERAKANKRMIYHYFGSKDALFTAVLEVAYDDIRTAEQKLELTSLSPKKALIKLVEFTWDYYLENPEFLTLINSENLHKARHLKESTAIRKINDQFVDMVQEILDRGVNSNEFRDDISAKQLNITIAALGYYYLTNRHTLSIILDVDFMSSKSLKERLDFNIKTIMRLVELP